MKAAQQPVTWNQVRYSMWAPWYDRIVAAVGFDAARRTSIDRLALMPGARVLVAGAGTGLDLPHLPSTSRITAIDITPGMLARLRERARELGRQVDVRNVDARHLPFDDEEFDAVVMHLILAVMPDPEQGLREAARVVRRGGRIAVFDKFLRDDEAPSVKRRLLNLVAKPLFSDMNRRLGPLVAGTGLVIERDEPVAMAGMYRIATLRKPI